MIELIDLHQVEFADALNVIDTSMYSDEMIFNNQQLDLKELDFGAEHFGALCGVEEFGAIEFCELVL